jgi:hypothetical protein
MDLRPFAVHIDLARIARIGAGQNLDQRRLSRTVVAEQPDNFAGIKIDAGPRRRP